MRFQKVTGFAFLVGSIATAAVASAQLTTFTGGDVGEGLDLDGTFLYAVHAAADGNSYTARDVTFKDRNTPGVTFNFPQATTFGSPNYGASANDIAVANVNDYVIFAEPATFSATGLTIGQQYKLQLLYNEACCNRHFDIIVEGTTVGTDIYPGATQAIPPVNPGDPTTYDQTHGEVFTYTFTAGDTTLNVDLNAPGSGGDPNPIFDAFTLEAVPEPASLAFLSLAALPLLTGRRRRR